MGSELVTASRQLGNFDLSCCQQDESRFQPRQLDLILGDLALFEMATYCLTSGDVQTNRRPGGYERRKFAEVRPFRSLRPL
jgi:hypothetical protein